MPIIDSNTGEIMNASPQASQQTTETTTSIGYSKPQILDMLLRAKTLEKLDEAAALIQSLPNQSDREELNAKYDALSADLQSA